MSTPESPAPVTPARTSPSRARLKVAGAFAAIFAVAIVLALTAVSQAAPDESRSALGTVRTASTPSTAPGPNGAAGSVSRPVTVVGIGDSVTSGMNCSCETFVGLYARGLASQRGLKASAVNLGAAGWTSSQLLKALTRPGAFRDQVSKADVLLVTIGANDLVGLESRQPGGCPTSCYGPLVDGIGQNVEQIVAAAKATRPGHPPTILVTDYWNVFQDGDVGAAENGQAFQSWSDMLTRAESARVCSAARRSGATCVSLYAPFKGNGSQNPTSLLAADGDHPSSTGHQLIAATLLAGTPALIP
jgi:lysophospholipase L1-like esterase